MSPRPFARWFRAAAPLGLLLALAGCAWPAAGATLTARHAFAPEAPSEARADRSWPLRGREDFDPQALPEGARRRHQALWETLRTPEARARIEAWADSDDLYAYGRYVQEHVLVLLSAFRVTGDLALLDEVHRLAEIMRGHLHDSWRGAARGDRGGRDGYLNWVHRSDDSEEYGGKDLHETDEMRTHALIAEVAWALENNRDLTGPAGRDYGEAADFWVRYLREHFEAKWRERNEVRWPRFPFIARDYVHPTTSFVRYHYYLYRLTGQRPYRQEAERLSRLVFREFREVGTEAGPALVWPRGLVHEGNLDNGFLMPSTYAGYVFGDVVDLHLEGFDGWADPRLPAYLATTLGTLMARDDVRAPLTRDVGGGTRRAGLRASPGHDWDPTSAAVFARKSFALITPWSEGGTVASLAERAFAEVDDENRFAVIPAGLLLDALLDPPRSVTRSAPPP